MMIRLLAGAVLTVALIAASWGIWTGAEMAVRGTLLARFGYLVPVLAVFAFLSIVEIAIARTLKAVAGGTD